MSADMGTVTLPSGAQMPLLGFGTWRLQGADATAAVSAALDLGYGLVDTATMYANEEEVGAALRTGVFVTTKLQPDDVDRARGVLENSIAALGRVDLWLQHWPLPDNTPVWRDLIAAQREGLVGDIGVSNYSPAQLDGIAEATGVMPAVNQIPWSPLRFDADLLQAHRDRGVAVTGYSGLKNGVLDQPAVQQVAERTGRSGAQVVLRWHLQHGIAVIPKSTHPERIAANADLAFELSEQDMAALDALGS
jgi:diketogulonate reductase-like aldo/keto reductase